MRFNLNCHCLATNAVSINQWAFQFKLWSTIRDDQICRFTSDSKEGFRGNVGVVVTTYNMVAFGGKRSEESEKIIEKIRNREWGFLFMDEVHIVPAHMFREVLLALEQIEQDEELTYEQVLMLEANFLFSGTNLHDQHSDMRLDIDNMSYEVCLG